ncbi:hypothetical protein TSUD_95940 [Trifolium subterraneum]|uniref:Uncharacterized protein n=1 Tax=Trifolium subterraneum TaxID=3900 RepID=A0A2Z6NNT3_TRISU|nr:hypothetical protein TSUD_95940 [Trifolium subterraneum]
MPFQKHPLSNLKKDVETIVTTRTPLIQKQRSSQTAGKTKHKHHQGDNVAITSPVLIHIRHQSPTAEIAMSRKVRGRNTHDNKHSPPESFNFIIVLSSFDLLS